MSDEKILYSASPSMFRNRPILFTIFTLLLFGFLHRSVWFIGFLGVGCLFLWWIRCKGQTLTITSKRSTFRKGILSKSTSEVWHENVRNVQMSQSLFQRILRVGSLGISSAGQSGMEIEISGIANPAKAKQIIDEHRE